MRDFLVASTSHCSGHIVLCQYSLLLVELEQDPSRLEKVENSSTGNGAGLRLIMVLVEGSALTMGKIYGKK